MQTTTTEVELLEKISTGDEEAMIAFHHRYVNLVYSMARRVLQDQADIEEVTQDVFMTIWHRAVTFDTAKGKVSSWLLTITRRRAIDYLRRRNSLANRVYSLDTLEEWLPASSLKAKNIDLSQAMAQLPPEQKHCLELIYYQGYTHREVAEMLALPLGTVKGRIRLAMKKLRLAMTEPVDINT